MRHKRHFAIAKFEKKAQPARWCSGESVRIAVGRPGVHSLSRVIPKDFKNWYSQLPCLALSIERDSVENKPASLLVVPLGKALSGTPHLYVADRWPTRTSPDYNCEDGMSIAVHAVSPSRGRGGVTTNRRKLTRRPRKNVGVVQAV